MPGAEEDEEDVEETEDEESAQDSDFDSYLTIGQRRSGGFYVPKSGVSSFLMLLSDTRWEPELSS